MLTFDEKFICIHNAQTLQHFIIKTELQPETILTTNPSYFHAIIGSYDPPRHSTGVESIQKPPEASQIKQKSVDPPVKIQQHILEVKVINFKYLFQKLGIYNQQKLRKQIYVPQFDRYCQFRQFYANQDCVPVQYTQGSVILLRYSNGYHINRIPNIFRPFSQSQFVRTKNEINQRQKMIYQKKVLEKKQKLETFRSSDQIYHSGQLLKDPTITKNKIQKTSHNSEQQQDIKQRDRSRSIAQIMHYVRKWRNIADEGINGVKLNLQQAAVYVGIPKKSLDDYFYQLRVGQKYDFDFEANSNKNISFLRKFVKQKVPSRNREKYRQTNKGYHQESERQVEAKKQQNSNQKNSLKTSNITKLPKVLKLLHQSDKSQRFQPVRKISMNLSDGYDRKSNRLSDSQASSIPNLWPAFHTDNMKDGIFDDQDSFFNDFKCGNQKFLQYNHLLKNQESDKNNRLSAKEDSLSQNSFRNSLFDYGLGYCFFKKTSENQNANI